MNIKEDIVFRLTVIYVVAAIIAVLIIGRIFQLQFFHDEKYEKVIEEVQYKAGKSTPEKGDICDYNGKILATSQPIYEIRMDLASEALSQDTLNKYIGALADSLSKIQTSKTKEEHYSDLLSAKLRKDRFYLIKKNVNYAEYKRISNFPIFSLGQYKGGFIAIKRSKRIKPYKDLANRTIGGYRNGKTIGIEGYFLNELKGEEVVLMKRKIAKKWIPIAQEASFQTLSGKDVITTIDINYQDFAHHALLEQMVSLNADTGVVVLMEVETGEIKSIVNLQRNHRGGYSEGFNHAVGSAIEPGSTFKLASLIIGLEDGHFDLKDSIRTGNGSVTYHGFTIREASGHGYGTLSVKEVFEKSSNVGTAKLINNYYSDNPKRFINRLYAMDMDKKLGVEIKGEATPKIKYPGDPLWSGVSLPQMSIGYEVLLTPLQVLNFYNTIANNGEMVKPRLVKAIREHGEIVKEYNKEVINPSICSEATIKKAQIMLEGVVENGTAKNIKGSPYKIAGKTGTAQIASGTKGYKYLMYYGSFAGYFPVKEPKYSCIVVIKTKNSNRFYGSDVAAPVFRKIADKVYASSPNMRKEIQSDDKNGFVVKNVPYSKNGNFEDLSLVHNTLRIPVKGKDKIISNWVVTKESKRVIEYQNRIVKSNTVPKVIGMGLKDGLFLMEQLGLKVVVKGRGVIKEQSIPAGRRARKNQTIILTLG